MRRFNANLFSIKDLKYLRNQIDKYNNSLQTKIELFCKRLAEIGVEEAHYRIEVYQAIDKGLLYDSIKKKKMQSSQNKSVYLVMTDSEYAVFVEFGTGIVGKNNPYKKKFPQGVSWQYASGKTIHRISNGKIGWFYPTDTGEYRFTEGQISRPFMTDTATEIHNKIYQIAKEVFK